MAAADEVMLARRRAWLIASGSTEASIRERAIVIRAMTRRTGKSVLDVTRDDLILDLAREGISAATRSTYKGAMYGFFTWLQEEGYRPDNPAARLPRVRVPKREPNPFTTELVEELLHSGIYRRTRLWVLLYTYQALRAQEIAAVHSDYVDWSNRRIYSYDAKGGRYVWRPIHSMVWPELVAQRREGWIFPALKSKSGHVSAHTVASTLGKAVKRAGIKHRPHDMRAWHATELIAGGVSTIVVAASMRHADEQSVQKYAKVSDDTIIAAVRKLPRVQVPDRSMRKAA